MNSLLLELYTIHDGRQNPADTITVFKLDEGLINGTRDLSDELQLDAPLNRQFSVRRRLAIVSRVRFFHARMLLLGPILAQFCLSYHTAQPVEKPTQQNERTMLQPLSRNGPSVKGCILHPFDRSGIFGPVPAWWYSVLCMKSSTYPLLTLWHKHLLYPNVYTAVTILLAKRIRPEIGTSIKHHSNAVSWSRAIEIFKSYAPTDKVELASIQRDALEDSWLQKQMPGGYGPVFSMWARKTDVAQRLSSRLYIFQHATSLGNVESLMKWHAMSNEGRDPKVLLVSCGVEDVDDDMKADVLQGLESINLRFSVIFPGE
ncbi:cystathionine gamma-synthase [Aspergillus flavus]|nr:cystathionine gamma-synthase [Aspergillus flavus]RAQ76447.1 cystathionine gamma-synthase [Aspergillus flavus]